MKRAGDIVSLFERQAMKIGKKKKAEKEQAENVSPVLIEEQAENVSPVVVVVEEQTHEPSQPTVYMSNVTEEQTEDVSSSPLPIYDFSPHEEQTSQDMYYGPCSMYNVCFFMQN